MLNTWILFQILRKQRRLEFKLNQVINQGVKTMANLAVLQSTVVALGDKVTETEATLSGLASEVVRLKDAILAGDQEAVDALVAMAQGILDRLTASEDAADDQLPPVVVPPVEPPVVP